MILITSTGCVKAFRVADLSSLVDDSPSVSSAASIKIEAPADDTAAKDGVTVQGKCVAGSTVNIAGAGVNASFSSICSSAGTFSAALVFSAGDGTKNVIVSQMVAGREIAASRSFRKDTTAPLLEITSPDVNSAGKMGLQITGTCEAGVPVQIYGFAVIANSVASCPTGTFNTTVQFSSGDGVKNLFLAQTDAVGNVTTIQRAFIKDSVVPTLTLTAPAEGTAGNSGVTLTGTCESALNVNVKGAGVAAEMNTLCATGNFSIPIIFSQGDGSKNVIVSQTDAAGNNTSISRNFSRLSVGPSIFITQPIAGTAAKAGVTLQGTCSGNSQVTVSGSGLAQPVNAACTGGNFSAAVIFSNGDGTKNVNVSQTDSAGNTGMDSRNFAKDTVGPALTITEPAQNLAVKSSVAVKGVCENGSNVTVSGAGALSSMTGACSGGLYNISVNLSTVDGTKALDVSQSDLVGNSTTKSVQVVRDTVAPMVQFSDPADGTSAVNGLTIKGSCESNLTVNVGGSGISAATSQLCTAGTFNMAILFSSGDGSKTISISQTDAAGNIGSISRSFVRAAAPPATIDGAALYSGNCAACHGALATSAKRDQTSSQITSAIASVSAMAQFSSLTSAQISAIATALRTPVQPPLSCSPDTIAKPAIRRLNAREFTNSIHDVLGVVVNPVQLPADDLNGLGFDTDGSILRMTDLDSQKYLDVIQGAVNQLFATAVQTGFDYTCATSSAETTNRTCTSSKLSLLAQRALKKPLSAAELKRYVDLAKTESVITDGLKIAMTAMLMSPNFLYFNVDVSKTTTSVHTLTETELAHKLALMLWSSVPDDTLRNLAAQGQLKAALKAQVIRMVADSRFITGMGQGFVDRWLELAKLNGIARTDSTFTGFSDAHLQDMIQESRLFVQYIIRNDRPMSELLTAQYSFVNQRLASIYGVSGSFTPTAFPMTNLPLGQRSGLLTQPAIMTMTGKLDSTSPVKRGFWMTKRILCSEPPPPPPNIPPLDTGSGNTMTVKERLAAHRTSSSCIGCHSQMDPIGMGLENLSQIGRWRTLYSNSLPVDASETLASSSFNGPIELGNVLASRDDIKACITKHMVSYSLGRATQTADDCYIQQTLATTAASSSKGMLTLIQEMVISPLFTQQKVGE